MELIERLKNSLYVDDLVTGGANDDEVLDLYLKSKSIMQRGGLNLRRWNTYSTVVREAINRPTERVTPHLYLKPRSPSQKKTNSMQRPQHDHQSMTTRTPSVILSRCWAQFGILQPMNSRSTYLIFQNNPSCLRLLSGHC